MCCVHSPVRWTYKKRLEYDKDYKCLWEGTGSFTESVPFLIFYCLRFLDSRFKVQRNIRQQIVNKHKIKHDYGNIVWEE